MECNLHGTMSVMHRQHTKVEIEVAVKVLIVSILECGNYSLPNGRN